MDWTPNFLLNNINSKLSHTHTQNFIDKLKLFCWISLSGYKWHIIYYVLYRKKPNRSSSMHQKVEINRFFVGNRIPNPQCSQSPPAPPWLLHACQIGWSSPSVWTVDCGDAYSTDDVHELRSLMGWLCSLHGCTWNKTYDRKCHQLQPENRRKLGLEQPQQNYHTRFRAPETSNRTIKYFT